MPRTPFSEPYIEEQKVTAPGLPRGSLPLGSAYKTRKWLIEYSLTETATFPFPKWYDHCPSLGFCFEERHRQSRIKDTAEVGKGNTRGPGKMSK